MLAECTSEYMWACWALSRGNTQCLGLLVSLRAWGKCFLWVTNHHFYNHLLSLTSLPFLFKSFPFWRLSSFSPPLILALHPVGVSLPDYNVFFLLGVGFNKVSNQKPWVTSWRGHRKLRNGKLEIVFVNVVERLKTGEWLIRVRPTISHAWVTIFSSGFMQIKCFWKLSLHDREATRNTGGGLWLQYTRDTKSSFSPFFVSQGSVTKFRSLV